MLVNGCVCLSKCAKYSCEFRVGELEYICKHPGGFRHTNPHIFKHAILKELLWWVKSPIVSLTQLLKEDGWLCVFWSESVSGLLAVGLVPDWEGCWQNHTSQSGRLTLGHSEVVNQSCNLGKCYTKMLQL